MSVSIGKSKPRQPRERINQCIRSLLSSETLVDDLGVLVYAEVGDGLRVGRGDALGVTATLHGSGVAEGGEGGTSEGLHCGGSSRSVEV